MIFTIWQLIGQKVVNNMGKLNLKSNGTSYQDAILNYLEDNASESLIQKINAGKKTLEGCFNFIKDCAKKEAKAGCACIEDKVVYGWAVHFFEEDEIKETEKAEKVAKKEIKTEPKAAKVEENIPKKKAKKISDDNVMFPNQITLFDLGFGGAE